MENRDRPWVWDEEAGLDKGRQGWGGGLKFDQGGSSGARPACEWLGGIVGLLGLTNRCRRRCRCRCRRRRRRRVAPPLEEPTCEYVSLPALTSTVAR